MARLSQLVVGAAVLVLVTEVHAAELREPANTSGTPREAPGATAASAGQLLGVVTDAAGAPLESTLISASGPTGTALAVCGADGRFEFRDLPPGTYLLRAHISGFTTARRHVVEVRSGRSTLRSVSLRRTSGLGGAEASPALLAAGFAPIASGSTTEELVQPDDVGSDLTPPDGVDSSGQFGTTPHGHSEKAWRLRRARRSVLKEDAARIELAPGDLLSPIEPTTELGLAASSVGASGALPGGFPLSGQVHLLTRTTINSPGGLWSADVLPGQIAYVALGAPDGETGWGVRGAVTAGDSSSWVLAGSYSRQASPVHAIQLRMSYSRQRHPAGNVAGPLTPGASDSGQSREAGSIQADGAWAPTRQITVGYGASVARYGYLDDGRLFSPRAQLTVRADRAYPCAPGRLPVHAGPRGRGISAGVVRRLVAARANVRTTLGTRPASGGACSPPGGGRGARGREGLNGGCAPLPPGCQRPDDHHVRG